MLPEPIAVTGGEVMNTRLMAPAILLAVVALLLGACGTPVPALVTPTPVPATPTPTPAASPEIHVDCFPSFEVAAWQDLDGDGLWGASEPPLEGVEFRLRGMFAQTWGAPWLTDADGRLSIQAWAPGDCIEHDATITATPPEAYAPTTPPSVTLPITLATSLHEAQFGFRAVSEASVEPVAADGTCVPVNEAITISAEVFGQARFEEAISSYLNDGGPVDTLATSMASADTGDEPILLQVLSQDVTASGLPDILLAVTIPYGGGSGEAHVLFFTCQAGRYEAQILFRRAGAGSRAEGLYAGGGAVIESLRDLNGNGVPDVALSVNWLEWGEYYLLEWDGEQFSSLIAYEDLLGDTRHWIETSGGEVEILDLEGDGLYEIVAGEPGGEGTVIWRWDGERYSHDGDLDTTPGREQGLGAAWSVLSELGDGFLRLAASPLGSVWAIGRDSLLQYDGQAWNAFDLPSELREKISAETSSLARTVTDLAVTADDVLWVGTREDGLYRFASGVWRHDTAVAGLPDPGVRRLAVDTRNDLWALLVDSSGAGEGDGIALARYDGKRWQPFPVDNVDGTPDDIALSPPGSVWLSVHGEKPGPYFFDGNQWVWAMNGWDAGSRDMSLASSPAGEVWFGSDYGWVRWTGHGWQGLNVTLPAPFSFPVAVDAEGAAWGIVTQFCYWCKIPNYNENGAVYATPNRSCRFTAADGLGDPPLDPPPDPFTADPPRPDVVTDIAVAADGRVWFIAQGKITVFRPEGPVCDYAAPENVRSPEEPDLSACPTPPERFTELWQARARDLGCPVAGPGQPVAMAEQAFEGGWMLWRGEPATIWVLPIGRRFLEFEDTWDPTQPAYACPHLAPGQTPPTLQRGFGKVWCLEEGIREMLGQATGEEHGFETAPQAFESGVILATGEGVIYILNSRSDWERLE
jgi:hypothetical protein